MRRSTRIPVCVRSRTPAAAGVPADSIRSSAVAARASSIGSWAVAITSRSLTLSAIRRAEPASSTRSAAGCARRAATSGSPTARARSSTTRWPCWPASASGDRGQQRLLGLGSEPLEGADPLPFRRLAQRVDGVDLELVEQPSGALGTEAGETHHLDQAGGELGSQLGRGGDFAVIGQGDDLVLDGPADPRQLGGASLAGQRRHRGRGLAHRLGRVAVGDDPVDDGPIELGEIAQLVQRGRDFGVGGVADRGLLARRRGRNPTGFGRLDLDWVVHVPARLFCPYRAHAILCEAKLSHGRSRNGRQCRRSNRQQLPG